METVKLYVFEQQEVIKGFVMANNISEAMKIIQGKADGDTVNEEYFRDFILVGDRIGRADFVAEVRENYKGSSSERGMATAIVAESFDIFEFDLAFERVYGTV